MVKFVILQADESEGGYMAEYNASSHYLMNYAAMTSSFKAAVL